MSSAVLLLLKKFHNCFVSLRVQKQNFIHDSHHKRSETKTNSAITAYQPIVDQFRNHALCNLVSMGVARYCTDSRWSTHIFILGLKLYSRPWLFLNFLDHFTTFSNNDTNQVSWHWHLRKVSNRQSVFFLLSVLELTHSPVFLCKIFQENISFQISIQNFIKITAERSINWICWWKNWLKW